MNVFFGQGCHLGRWWIMPELNFVTIILGGAVWAGGVWLIICGLVRQPVRLGDALAQLDGIRPEVGSPDLHKVEMLSDASSRVERIGAAFYRLSRIPLSKATLSRLALAGRSIGDFFVEKLVLALSGLCLPFLVASLSSMVGFPLGGFSAVVGLAAMVMGFFVPDLKLKKASTAQRLDATEALSTYFDLVTLERMANMSAAQAALSAAQLSDVPVFVRIRSTLENSRLQQRPPWVDLRELAVEMELPALGDLADILALDDQGAALAAALRARVAELRDAHLMKERIAAQQHSERMTIWMSFPVMIFALIFLAPPLLRLVGVE